MASVTHDLENLLDRVRKNEMPLTDRIVDVTLAARDILLAQLAAHQGGEPVPDAQVEQMIALIREIASDEYAVSAVPLRATAPVVEPEPAPESEEAPALSGYIPLTPSAKVVEPVDEKLSGFIPLTPSPKPASAAPAPVVAAPVPAPVAPAPAPRAASSSSAAKGSALSESTSIRVSIERVDQLINLVGELVITQSMLAQTAQVELLDNERLYERLQQLERNTRELQESVMSIRMLPVSSVFSRFPRLVRDLAGKLGKQIELKTFGEATELDRGVIEKITDPLTHLIRNSVDHGIELEGERIAAGKTAKGTITLSAYHQGGSVVIQIEDDGRGLNRDKLLAKARERNIHVPDNPTDQDVWHLIFAPGFSTAEAVTDISGRGVGMDVVRRNIENLGGRVDLESRTGQGTTISIRLPLTLAIMDGMSVGIGQETYIVPLTAIIESLRPLPDDVKSVSGQERLVFVRGEYLPLVSLHEVFDLRPKTYRPDEGILIIVDTESGRAALFVDELLGQRQVVIKSLESNYHKVPGISAATIMGDGSVSMILDVSEVVRLSKRRPQLAAVS